MQYNDPDPVLWVTIYLAAAVLSVLAAYGRLPVVVLAIACLTCVAAAIYTWPEKYEGLEVGAGDIRNIEEAREALGLLLIAIVMFFYAILPAKTRRNAAKRPNLL